MADFKKQGGSLTGREERYDGFEGEPRGVGSALGGGSSTTGTSSYDNTGTTGTSGYDSTGRGTTGTSGYDNTGSSGYSNTNTTGKKPGLM